jgi:hypothetical protein
MNTSTTQQQPRSCIMQTLEQDYFIYDCKFIDAGREKFEDWFFDYKNENWDVSFDDVVNDMMADAVNSESNPFYVLDKMFSYDCGTHRIDLIENIDYVFEYKSFESHRLEQLARELNELHNIMQQEMQRLGW